MATRPVRDDEEEEENKSNIGRGLGLAAAAVGVSLGIGAALYYFFNKRQDDGQHAESSHQHNFSERNGRRGSWSGDASGYEDTYTNNSFRQRSWTLEECSICCEMMLPASATRQQLRMLPCGHKFHALCVQPWTDEHDTCPNCRKAC